MKITTSNTLPHQYAFAYADPAKVKHPAVVGGFGCGKTRSIPLRWLRLIDWRAREQKRKARLMIVEPTYQMVRDVLVPEMVEFFNDHGIKHRYHKSNHDFVIRLNGIDFVAMLRSADKPSSLTGKTVSDAIIDEFDKISGIQNQRDVWNECIARTRKYEHGTVGVVTTPEGYRYTYELWVERNADNPQFRLIKARTRDNHFLPADYIDNMAAQYDSLLAAQYLEGEFVNLNNSMAYYTFRRETAVQPCPVAPSLPVYIGMDFNVNPMTAVVFQQDGAGLRAVSEYWLPNSNTRALAQLIASDWKEHPVYICPDMTGGARKTSADMSDIQILQSFGFQTLGTRNITERARLNLVNNLLDKHRLTIDPKCKHLINDLEKVTTNEYGQVAKEKDSQLTHISDALGYACVVLDSTSRSKWGIQ
jgi:phage terminase large subunit